FIQPVYAGDHIIVQTVVDATSAEASPLTLSVTAQREDGTVCAVATATLGEPPPPPRPDDYPRAPLPAPAARPPASRESLVAGAHLGTLREPLDLKDSSLLDRLDERLTIYRGDDP